MRRLSSIGMREEQEFQVVLLLPQVQVPLSSSARFLTGATFCFFFRMISAK